MKFALFSTALLASGLVSASTAIDGWYLSGFGGVTHIASNVKTGRYGIYVSDARYNLGYNAGFRLGFQSNPIRYEFEYTFLYADADRFHANFIPQQNIIGHAEANLVMANLYYDFPEFLDTLSPFVGVGIGYAFTKTKLGGNDFYSTTLFNADVNEFAYQGTVGLTYNFSENYAINAAYRYTATASSGHLGKSFQTQMGNAGIIYRFDRGNYK